MPISLVRPLRSWLVVFHDDPYAMRIVAVHPAPGDDGDNDELVAELYVANLASFYVDAPSAGQARLTARQLHDVERIRTVCARLRADRSQPRTAAPRTCPAPRGHQALARASRDVALTRHAAKRAEEIVATALRAGYRHRPVRQHHLTYEQFVDHLTANAAGALYKHAALVAAGRTEEAVAVLINALGSAATTH
ncbi:hypothetical protein [Streptomyces sp. NBC_01800]|uniref:hypothetical protein n=1 Tax=Streptomyces sp. NBC_01800 TaxID=2975945 RepID=UPI002DDA1ECA|nr:hypothetical protein [Streptomyces sp. NBC_01800]WSA68837.1 hypothetical protein OIE65_18625 [Streptomyces sp. NBC_01800]